MKQSLKYSENVIIGLRKLIFFFFFENVLNVTLSSRQEEKQFNRPSSAEGELPPISRSSSPTAAEKDILVSGFFLTTSAQNTAHQDQELLNAK